MRPAREITKGYYLTKTGTLPNASDLDPFMWFQVVPRLASPEDTAQYAVDNLNGLTSMKEVEVVSQTPIELVGLKGTETIANSLVTDSGKPQVVYFVNLHGTEQSVMIRGTVGRDDPEKFMDEFRRVARGLTKSQ